MSALAFRGRSGAFFMFGICLLVLVAGALSPAGSSAEVPDPGLAGPYAFKRVDYRAGQIALTLPQRKKQVSFNQPLRGSLTYPESEGPWPVALMLHGRHGTCVDKDGVDFIPEPSYENPNCPDLTLPDGTKKDRRIRSYDGYRYLAGQLASQGYLVISPDANLLMSYEFFSERAGIRAREQVIGATLDLLRRWNLGTEEPRSEEPGLPAAGELTGRIQLSHLAIMGHSRGGDAATQFIAFNQKRSTIYPLGGVVAIGPTDIPGTDPFRYGATNLAELLPGCDGDVSDLEGGHVFERVKRSHRGDGAELFQWVVQGANHNFFNTIWTEDDARYSMASDLDSACSPTAQTSIRASRAGQRSLGISLVNGFIRRFSGAEAEFGPALKTGALPASTCQATIPLRCDLRVRSSYIAPASERLLVLSPSGGRKALKRNQLGGKIDKRGLSLQWCDATEIRFLKQKRRCPGGHSSQESQINRSWTRQLVVTWKKRSKLTTAIPAAKADVSRFGDLVIRASTTLSNLNPVSNSNLRTDRATQRMDIVLTDKSGARSRVPAEEYSSALNPTAGDRTRQLLLGDITIPLAAFSGVDLTGIRSVELGFGVRGRKHGQVQLSDFSFQGSAVGEAPVRQRLPGGAATVPVPGPGTAVDAISLSGAASVDGSANCTGPAEARVVSGPELTGGLLRVSGSSDFGSCDGRVQVALFRRNGDKCQFVSADGEFGPGQRCDQPFSMIAERGEEGSWSLSIPFSETPELPEVTVAAIPGN